MEREKRESFPSSLLQQPRRAPGTLALSPFLISLPSQSSGAQKQAELGKTAEGFAETFKAEVREEREKRERGRLGRG